MPMYRGEVIEAHPEFPEGSEAVAKLADGPVPIDAPKIKYTEADDKAIEEYVKQHREPISKTSNTNHSHVSNLTVSTTWHSVCGGCDIR